MTDAPLFDMDELVPPEPCDGPHEGCVVGARVETKHLWCGECIRWRPWAFAEANVTGPA